MFSLVSDLVAPSWVAASRSGPEIEGSVLRTAAGEVEVASEGCPTTFALFVAEYEGGLMSGENGSMSVDSHCRQRLTVVSIS